MARGILVPLDGSPLAEEILPQLARLSLPPDAELILLRACPLQVVPGMESAPLLRDERAAEESQAYLHRVEHRLRLGGRKVRSRIIDGDAATAILNAAEEEGAALIALSTHGRTGLARLVLGSTAEKVLRAARAPLFLSRSFAAPARPGPFRALVLPLDGSPVSRGAVPALLAFARGVDARVTLVHVLQEPAPPPHWLVPGDPLGAVEKELRHALLPVETDVRTGDPAAEILNACRARNADLLVMSTHGRSGPVRWLFGSVTEKVLRESPLPMLVVPAAAAGVGAPSGS
jgi:nucleotide-binding universal stress UspA family protein